MAIQRAFNFKQWINDHRHLLKPPVGNQQVYKDNSDFIVMVVGGPNSRKDYHFNEGEEFYYQVEGNMVLKIMEDGKNVDIPINEGDIFLLPPKTPHSPQRPAGTVGLVVELYRHEKEMDGCFWYCENCGNELHKEFFPLTNIVTELPRIFDKFYSNLDLRTCKVCGTVMEPPPKLA